MWLKDEKVMDSKQALARTCSVLYGKTTITYFLSFSDRKTLAIHVFPNKSVVVEAPVNTSLDKIEAKVIKRAKWIRTQQNMFDRLPPALPARKYVTGETFRYLGRQYRLKIEEDLVNKVILHKGRIFVCVTNNSTERVKELVDNWYKERATIIFQERLKICLKEVVKAKISYSDNISLRVMKLRWGSCTKNKKIILNPELVAAPKDCIDYVITHELCHIKEHNHGNKFYDLLSYVMPDWAVRKEKLNCTVEARSI
jgi:predicted metal-dependent hydrolase